MEDYEYIKECLACGSDRLSNVIDLGDQPLANSPFKTGQKTFPLELKHCLRCGHAQLSCLVNPELMFLDYPYVSGTSKTLHQFFEAFAKDVKLIYNPKNILDIACNDGTQLDYFKQLGVDTWGIDPSSVGRLAGEKGHKFFNEFFGKNTDVDAFPKFNVILAQNVFAHTGDPLSFLTTAKRMLSPGGVILIQTSQANMVKNGEFDTIYHEHVSFFNPYSMSWIANRTGLRLSDVQILDVHGQSFLFELRNDINTTLIEEDYIDEMMTTSDYRLFYQKAKTCISDFRYLYNQLKKSGYCVIGYGAAAKGNTFLNAADIHLDAIIDDNPLKHGTLTSGTLSPIIPINKAETFVKDNKVAIVILAWNFEKEIKEKAKEYFKNPLFIQYFPEAKITL